MMPMYDCATDVSELGDWPPIDRQDPEGAAEKHARRICEEDPACYDSFQGRGQVVYTREVGDPIIHCFLVIVEFDPWFHATAVDSAEELQTREEKSVSEKVNS